MDSGGHHVVIYQWKWILWIDVARRNGVSRQTVHAEPSAPWVSDRGLLTFRHDRHSMSAIRSGVRSNWNQRSPVGIKPSARRSKLGSSSMLIGLAGLGRCWTSRTPSNSMESYVSCVSISAVVRHG